MIKKYLTLVFLVTLLVSPFGGAYGLTIIPSGGTPYNSEDTPFNQRTGDGGLSPLEITNLQSNDIVYWDGTKWVNASSTSIVDLSTKADLNGNSSEDFSIKHLDALTASISETISMATDVVKIYPKLNLKPQALPTTPDTGDIVIDSGDANKLKYYDGSAWQTGSGGGGASLVAGIANFAGYTASTTVTIAAQANTNYKVLVTPSENPGGNLGEVWVEKLSTTQFAVHNSGSAVTEFNWGVTP